MKISILTLFPEMFSGPFGYSIIQRAQEKNLVELNFVNIRDFGTGKHKVVDDKPYGGGTGMIMKVDVLDTAIRSVREGEGERGNVEKCVLLDARGNTFHQAQAKEFSRLDHLILICGHYEGIDERVRSLVDTTISIGDFIVTGGEIPAMLITDAVSRLVTGVLKEEATSYESFSSFTNKTLEYPQYTLPREYKGMTVPDVLISGNHKEIEKWKREQSRALTEKHRPDLL